MREVSMANTVAARSEREASANAGLGVATDGRKCSSRGSELLVEWPSPRANRKDDGRQESASEDHANGDANGGGASCSSSQTSTTDQQQTSTDQQQTTPTAVHFSPTIRIKIIPSLQDYSPERIERTYYTQADYAELKREYAATAKEMRRRHRRGEDPLQVHEVKLSSTARHEPHPQQQQRPSPTAIITATTTRGLEHMAAASTLEFHLQEKSNSIDAVLLAQENDSTPEEIAVLYGRRARMALARATRQGLDDAQHAHFY